MLRQHLTDEDLVGYIHHTLTDARRETFDDLHLLSCPVCREHLDQLKGTQQDIRLELQGGLRRQKPSPNVNFTALRPSLKRNRRWAGLSVGARPGRASNKFNVG